MTALTLRVIPRTHAKENDEDSTWGRREKRTTSGPRTRRMKGVGAS